VSTALRERPAQAVAGNGGVPARRAVIRWAWRLFRREWRQQLLVLALIVVAVAATIVGAAVATNTPSPAGAGFGTARDLATLPGTGPQLATQIAGLRHRFGASTSSRTRSSPFPARSTPTTCAPRTPVARSGSRCSPWSAGTTRPIRARWR
jgi:putative ABC transport system permease protein